MALHARDKRAATESVITWVTVLRRLIVRYVVLRIGSECVYANDSTLLCIIPVEGNINIDGRNIVDQSPVRASILSCVPTVPTTNGA